MYIFFNIWTEQNHPFKHHQLYINSFKIQLKHLFKKYTYILDKFVKHVRPS